MSNVQLNPIVIDSRFFEKFKKILEIVLMILDFFDDDGNITDSKIDEMLTLSKGMITDYPEVKKDIHRAVALSELATQIKPVKSESIIMPHYGPVKDFNA